MDWPDNVFSQEKQKYMVLLILTDGVFNDMAEVIAAIVEASEQPLSIAIVGVGSADFAGLYVLHALKVTQITLLFCIGALNCVRVSNVPNFPNLNFYKILIVSNLVAFISLCYVPICLPWRMRRQTALWDIFLYLLCVPIIIPFFRL